MIRRFAAREAVFFDFDGVLVDSMAVKTRAFARLYEHDAPHIMDAVAAYHCANGGVSRYKKFEHYERVLLGREPTDDRLTELGGRFASLVVEEVIASPEIPGAISLLERLKARSVPCYVVSGTPEDELKAIVERRGMRDYFRATRGSPAEKARILRDLLDTHRYQPARCLMVGDAVGDYEAAASVGMDFLGVVKSGEASPFPSGVLTVEDFTISLETAS